MGIHQNLMWVMRELARRENFRGRLCTLGVQDMPPGTDAGAFYGELGFTHAETLDSSDYEGAQHVFDLNGDALPSNIVGKFDAVFNGGTIEHVFHVPNALASMTAMLRPGGVVMHLVPTNGWVEHGFYQISPTLLHDYYEAAGFVPLMSVLMSYELDDSDRWLCRSIAPGDLGDGLSGVIDRGIHLFFFAARRSGTVIARPIPQQRFYSGKDRGKTAPWFMPHILQSGVKMALPEAAKVALTEMGRQEGHAWYAALPNFAQLSDNVKHPGRSPLILLEDGAPLGPGHTSHQAIRERGGGAFSHWEQGLLFSTPDNSDPNTNGRAYVALLHDPAGSL